MPFCKIRCGTITGHIFSDLYDTMVDICGGLFAQSRVIYHTYYADTNAYLDHVLKTIPEKEKYAREESHA